MRVKLLKTQIINEVSNVEPVRAGQVVEVSDADGKEMVKSGYAEETSAEVTAQAKAAPTPDNKMAPDTTTKQAATTAAAPRAVTAAGGERTRDTGGRTPAKTGRGGRGR